MAQPQTPALTVDVVIPSEDGLRAVLIKRAKEPFEGSWALPGGFVEIGESAEQAAAREVKEETGLEVRLVRLIGVYSDPGRDPRGHNVSVAYLARAASGKVEDSANLAGMEADTDASKVALLELADTPLAFDHRRIVREALSPGLQESSS